MNAGGVLALIGAASLSLGGCGRPLGEDECRALLDHYTEKLVLEEDPSATPATVAHRQSEARAAGRRERRFELGACPKRVSRRDFECAMAAPNVDSIERCLVF